MKKEFERPELTIIVFSDDVIVCSGGIDPINDEGEINYPPIGSQNPFHF